MNVFKNDNNNSLNESLEKKVDKLFESFKNSGSLNQFLAENGNSEENIILYHFMSLNESQDENNRFTFENGMYIPGLGSKATGRLTINRIAEYAKSVDDFISSVSSIICEDKLMFKPSETDIKNLTESFESHAKKLMVD